MVSFLHMCMQINCSMCLNCLLLASTRALSCDAVCQWMRQWRVVQCWAKPLAGAVEEYHTDVKW